MSEFTGADCGLPTVNAAGEANAVLGVALQAANSPGTPTAAPAPSAERKSSRRVRGTLENTPGQGRFTKASYAE